MKECQWNYIQNDESCVLGIPYVNNSAWMSPNPYVIARIPVMDISYEFKLKESLQKLGMKDAFVEDICNLTKMIKEPSKLNKIIHKAVIKIDEYGIEASAATSIYDLRCGGRIERFKADHPFLFFITTNNPKDFKPINILFIGTFC
uniref:Serpin domain-containing protein n=1 Tax=Panagrolaimus davidi TaxID=227884 RepID=A0A914P6D5_9BILA